MLAAAGLGCGLSPAFYGYFDISAWGPIALALIAVAIGLLLARPALPTGLAAVGVTGLLLLASWALLSIGWAESADRALIEGDRWIMHAVFLLLLVLLISDRLDGEIFVFSAALGVLCIAGYDLAEMLGGDGPALFAGSRLLEPLGYVNGLGGYFLLGFWPLIALAERVRIPVLAGTAAGGATLLAALVLLTESRGTAFAFAASAIVALVLFPGRGRRAWLLLAVLGGLALAWGPLTDVTQPLPADEFAPPAETIRRAAEWSLLAAGIVASVWAVACWAIVSLRRRSGAAADYLPRISAALLGAVAVVLLVSATAAVSDPVSRVSEEYDAFTELEPAGSGDRFTSGGGNRYDYWRIAWGQFADDPVRGIGAGNFDRTYFLERRTNEDVRQAHSIELQALGETGIVGALALGAFLVAVFAGIWRWAQAGRSRQSDTALGVAATGVFVVWLAQTSVDWLHLIPGVTGIALGAAAVLFLPPGSGEEERYLRRLPPLATVAALVLAVVAIVFIGRPTLADRFNSEAQQELERSRPRAALSAAADALSLNPDSLQAYYAKAAALARLGAYRPAKLALLEAVEREPHNYVSWALLGDLATRRGDIAYAQRVYERASRLNPRDRELRRLGSRRALVERLHERSQRAL